VATGVLTLLYWKYNLVVEKIQRQLIVCKWRPGANDTDEVGTMGTTVAADFLIQYLDELGAGVWDFPVGSEWAVKRLNSRWQAEPTARARFEREIEVLSIMSHPNVVSCRGLSLPGAERFYLMPLYRDSVRRMIDRRGCRLDVKRIAAYGAVLADALGYAHGSGFIHRDIKPDNILFNPGGPLVIADWGIGYFIHQHSRVLQTHTRGGLGTAYYCSFEQWTTGKCDARGDIYALGMTLDEWLWGGNREIRIGGGIGLRPAVPGQAGGAALASLLDRMTRPRVNERPSSMTTVTRELQAIAEL
jgi:serine/threonine protein kinase